MDAYLGELRLFPFTFAPANWLPCDGRSLNVNQYAALYAVIGSAFGQTNALSFSLPDLRGQTAMGGGSGPGLTPRVVGQHIAVGGETDTLTTAQLPAHTHTLNGAIANDSTPPTGAPAAGSWFTYPQYSVGTVNWVSNSYLTGGAPITTLAGSTLAAAGTSQSHPNMQPYLPVQWCICVEGGEFPVRP